MTTVDEKEILEIEEIKASVRKMTKEVEYMSRKEFLMFGATCIAFGSILQKVLGS